MTPDITPAIPNRAKFFSGTYTPISLIFHNLEKRKPVKQPINSEGANVPPQPPPPFVAEVAKTFVNSTKAI